ncbi:MAG: hypothetical protein ACR2FE_08680 [Aeromicrobium sp.]
MIVGVLAMHDLIAGQVRDGAHHVALPVQQMSAFASTVDVTEVNATQFADPLDTGSSGPLSACGGPMMLCLAMIMGVSAYIVLRRRAAERPLWQLPTHAPVWLEATSIDPRVPLQRSSLLRC